MVHFAGKFVALRALCVTVLSMLAVGPLWAAGSTTVVISQMYGAGGNSGATYNADYIELFNLSSAPVSLNGYAIQYGSATGTAISQVSALPSGITLQPGQRYLISGTPGTTGAALPSTADAVISTIALGASAGRVFLTSTSTMLASSCPGAGGTVVDFIGYGTTDTCFEGSTYAPAPSTTQADIRTNACTDTDQNGTDFSLGAPAPRNSGSTTTPCVTTPIALGLSAAATPATVITSGTTLLTAVVTPATQPASTGIVVTADISALGGSTAQPLYDDGTHGDATAGDSTYSFTLTIPGSQAANSYTINFKAVDSQLRSATASAPLTVHLSGVAYSNVVLSASSTSAVAGTMLTLSAVVTGNQSAAPTGTVKFLDGGTTLNSATVANGLASITSSALTVGQHILTAVYSGDSIYPAFTSSPVTVTITVAPVADFDFTIANTAITVAGDSPKGTSTLNVAMVNGFSQAVTFACSGLPTGASCGFAPASLSASGSSVLTIAINGVHASSRTPKMLERGGGLVLAFGLLGLPMLLKRRGRTLLHMALGCLLLGAALVSISGCGSGSSTAAGASTVTVTASGGGVTHSATITLNVQ